MITQPPNESSFDDGQKPRKSWVDWCMSVFRDFKYKGSGPTSSRPVNGLNIGDWFFDTTINRPVFVINISPVTWSDIGFSTYFESAEQTITSGGILTIAHGLGRKPALTQTILKCLTAENGYSVGDEIEMPPGVQDVGASRGFYLIRGTTNLIIRFGSTATTFIYGHATTAAVVALTNANWSLIIRAWA